MTILHHTRQQALWSLVAAGFRGVAGDEERAEQDGDRVRHQRPGCQVATASAAKLLAGEGASPLRLLDVAL